MTVIPAGYRLHVTSWENDGSRGYIERTEIIEGLIEGELCFLVDLANIYRSVHDQSHPGFGNLLNPSELELLNLEEAQKKLYDKHKDRLPINYLISENYREGDVCNGFYYDMFGESDNYVTRALSDIKIEYVEAEITFLDVTEKYFEK